MSKEARHAALSLPETINLIFENLHWKSIPIVRQVCSKWYNIAKNNNNIKYKFKYYSEFGGPLRLRDPDDYDEEEYERRLEFVRMDWKGKYSATLAEIKEMKETETDLDRLNDWFTEWAIYEGHYNFLKKLIRERKYSIEFYEGDPILSECLSKNDSKTFKVLLKYCSDDFEDELHPERLHSSLLHEATRLGNLKFVKLLLDAEVDINHYEDGEGTPIHTALNEDSEEIVLLFLEKGANLENVFEAYHFEDLIEHWASKLWARSIIIFTEKERLQRLDGMMFVKSSQSQTRTSVIAIESIIEDQLELLQYINDAIDTIRGQDQTIEATSAIQLLEQYAKELESKCNEVIEDLKNTYIKSGRL